MLAILVQTARREFVCCTSIGECLTTHMGVTALAFVKPCGYLALGILWANKKLPQPEQDRITLFQLIAV